MSSKKLSKFHVKSRANFNSKVGGEKDDEQPVWIEDNLLLSFLRHPVDLELPLVLQLRNWDGKPLVVDLFCLTRPD